MKYKYFDLSNCLNISLREMILLGSFLLITWLGLVWVHYQVIQQFPNSADEHNYLYSAALLSSGKISASAHPLQEFFSPFFILTHEGKVFSLFPPGWPLLLSGGVKLGIPGLINPSLAVLTLLIWFGLAWKLAGRVVAWLTITCMAFSPFFIFNSVSFFSHPCCLFLLSGSLACLMLYENCENPQWAVVAGFLTGWSLATRELTTAVFMAVPLMWMFFRQPLRWRFLIFFVMGFIPTAGTYLWYNASLTGQWFVPVRFLKPDEWLGFGPRDIRLFDYHEIRQHGPKEALVYMVCNFGRLLLWTVPGLPLLAVWGWWKNREEQWIVVLAVSALSLPLAYTLYAADGAAHYGPRFYYESLGILSFLGALGIQNLWRKVSAEIFREKKAMIWGAGILILCGQLAWHIHYQTESIYSHRTLERLIASRHPHNAVIIIGAPSGNMTQGDLIRNAPFLEQSDVIYAWDLGPKNEQLFKAFPKRVFYYFAQDRNTRAYYLKLVRIKSIHD